MQVVRWEAHTSIGASCSYWIEFRRRRRRSRDSVFRRLTTEDGMIYVKLTSGRHINPSEDLKFGTFLLSFLVCGNLASFTVTDYLRLFSCRGRITAGDCFFLSKRGCDRTVVFDGLLCVFECNLESKEGIIQADFLATTELRPRQQ